MGYECSLVPAETMSLGNGNYKWRIFDYGVYGNGSWTTPQEFTLDFGPTAVVLGQPSGPLTSWDGSFHWTGIPSATWYLMEVQDGNGGTLLSRWYSVGAACVGLDCAVTPEETLTLPNGVYQWRIQDYGSNGYGSWTTLQGFTLNR